MSRVRAKSGLTYKFLTSEVRLVKQILENNGFIDVDEIKGSQPLIQWSSSMIKSQVY